MSKGQIYDHTTALFIKVGYHALAAKYHADRAAMARLNRVREVLQTANQHKEVRLMNTSLAKKPASFMREHTQSVRDHAAAMARLTDQYLASLKRAEAQYFDGVRRITEAVTAETEPVAIDETPAEASAQPPPA